ncbi:unnamed protein product, partial [Urochloa humidicola]
GHEHQRHSDTTERIQEEGAQAVNNPSRDIRRGRLQDPPPSAGLPVKTLVRFRSVSKAWRVTTSDPFFISSHLQQSTSWTTRSERGGLPSFLITPHALDMV